MDVIIQFELGWPFNKCRTNRDSQDNASLQRLSFYATKIGNNIQNRNMLPSILQYDDTNCHSQSEHNRFIHNVENEQRFTYLKVFIVSGRVDRYHIRKFCTGYTPQQRGQEGCII